MFVSAREFEVQLDTPVMTFRGQFRPVFARGPRKSTSRS